jgi:hypothetical protein
MARRLYSVGLLNEVQWSKSSGTESCSLPICIQRIQHDNSGLAKQQYHSSEPAVMARYSTLSRSNISSAATLSVHIQSMKKSAFKMLCKFIRKLKINIQYSQNSNDIINSGIQSAVTCTLLCLLTYFSNIACSVLTFLQNHYCLSLVYFFFFSFLR